MRRNEEIGSGWLASSGEPSCSLFLFTHPKGRREAAGYLDTSAHSLRFQISKLAGPEVRERDSGSEDEREPSSLGLMFLESIE